MDKQSSLSIANAAVNLPAETCDIKEQVVSTAFQSQAGKPSSALP